MQLNRTEYPFDDQTKPVHTDNTGTVIILLNDRTYLKAVAAGRFKEAMLYLTYPGSAILACQDAGPASL